MRILYIDVDSQRPDHLGCYGYHRNTSPNIDRIAKQGVRFDNCYVTDAPCLPSRTALWSGRFGIHNGVINHGGVAADPFVEGRNRMFRSTLGRTSWMQCLRNAGLKTVTVSPFGERHSAWHWYANFNEVYNTGKGGMERADEISPVAIDWIKREATKDNWFLHVNLWDPHTPYRTPDEFGNPFKDEPLPKWLTEEVRDNHFQSCGPHSAQEVTGFGEGDMTKWIRDNYPQQPLAIDSMNDVRRMFDGYDRGVRYADDHIGRILNALADQNVLDETVIVISSDHGENLGELNIYGDHQTADHITSRVPLIVKWPGIPAASSHAGAEQRAAPGASNLCARSDTALHYHFDFAATMIELLGQKVPDIWDGRSFAPAFKGAHDAGRGFLVVSQGAWSCQRSVRFDDYIAICSYHDGYHCFPHVMLFDVKNDPHEQNDLAQDHPELVSKAMAMLEHWHGEMMRTATHNVDPMWTVLQEGGPLHTRGLLKAYLERLKATSRSDWAERLLAMHPKDL